MSAIVFGKRNLFEEIHSPNSSVSKRIRRCSSTSPVRHSPQRSFQGLGSSLFSRLKDLFPDMEPQLLERTLEACNNDLDSAIKSLNDLRLEVVKGSTTSEDTRYDLEIEPHVQLSQDGNNKRSAVNLSVLATYPVDGSQWVEFLVREMTIASNMDDAIARASRLLEALEKSIMDLSVTKTEDNLLKENEILKEQSEGLIRDNTFLKQAVAIQHERHKEYEDKCQELHQLRELASQSQERVRTLEVNNYALTLHLRQSQQRSSIPGHFHLDIF